MAPADTLPRAVRTSSAHTGSAHINSARTDTASTDTAFTDTADTDTTFTDTARKDRDGKAVVGFIAGLVGLLFGNPVLGPLAIVLGVMSLRGETSRRGRALLAIGLGAADLAVFAVLALHAAAGPGGFSWHFA